MDPKARRNLGAPCTSEQNILKLIKPLFLDELCAEFGRIRGNRARLLEFHKRLRWLNFLDPTAVQADRYKAGDSIDALAQDFGASRDEIEEAIRCELALQAA